MSETIPKPNYGRLTFNAEGQEKPGSIYHSRHLHVPGPTSGLTIGRGFDMKNRTSAQIRADLVAAGVPAAKAALLSRAAGLSGDQAEDFIQENDLEDFEITPEAQLKLFKIDFDWHANDCKRIATKEDVVRRYGPTNWETLNQTIKDVVVDLRFRGDYTPRCRGFLQEHIVANDLRKFSDEICERTNWPNVPKDRFERRRNYCRVALGI